MNNCPECAERGRKINAVTLEHHVKPTRLAEIDEIGDWRLCRSADCPVVYFRGENTVLLAQMSTTPFQKSDAPDRLVCFCFKHTVQAVHDDVLEHGTSAIQTAIKEACRLGQDDCERQNPQGRCCLGNVAQVVKQVGVDQTQTASALESDACESSCCCGSKADKPFERDDSQPLFRLIK